MSNDALTVNEALQIVESFGDYGDDLNETHRIIIVLRDEIKRLRQTEITAISLTSGMGRGASVKVEHDGKFVEVILDSEVGLVSHIVELAGIRAALAKAKGE